MLWFATPQGEAGADQVDAMEESIQAAIEQMFWQLAKRDTLSFGVGRTATKSSGNPDRDGRLDAQKRECDGLIVFHAGKALETSLQLIYAKINNRILAREYPGVSARANETGSTQPQPHNTVWRHPGFVWHRFPLAKGA